MFDRIKKALFGSAASSDTQSGTGHSSLWAHGSGESRSSKLATKSETRSGTVSGKAWRLEIGKPSRDFIEGQELRMRCDLGLRDDAAVLVLNRALKDTLDKRAYSLYTDSLQTTADPHLPEEMRWLAMYEEMGWESADRVFWTDYSVLSDRMQDAAALVTDPLVAQLLSWPNANPDTPFILMVLRGKAYLRMQYRQSDERTLEHAIKVFTLACEQALSGLSTDLAL